MQAAINAVLDRDVLNEELDYLAEGERLLQRRSPVAQPQMPFQAPAAPQPPQQPPAVPPPTQPARAQSPASAAPQPPRAQPTAPAAKVGWNAAIGERADCLTSLIDMLWLKVYNFRTCVQVGLSAAERRSTHCRLQLTSASRRLRLRRGQSRTPPPLARAASASAKTSAVQRLARFQMRRVPQS